MALICLAVLALWLPDLNLPLGNSDDGRILGRFGLQARNFWELGPGPSRLGASIQPFARPEYNIVAGMDPPVAAVTYAHHPPLPLAISIASFGLLGDSLAALRAAGFVLGSATIAFMAALLRVRGLAWGPTLLAVSAMAATGFFYVYARIGVGFSLLVAALAMVAWLREAERCPRWALAGAVALSALTAMQSWIAMAALALSLCWLFTGGPQRRRSSNAIAPDAAAASFALRARKWLKEGCSPALTAVAAGAALGVAATALWILNATDLAEISGRVSFRVGNDVETLTQSVRFSFGEFLQRQWGFASEELLAPLWLRALLAPALIVGLIDRRTRAPVAITLAVAAAWTFGAQQGAWLHRLWNFPWLAPATVGLAALADLVRRALPARWRGAAAAVAAAVAAATLFAVVTGSTRDRYLTDPAAGGAALEQALGSDAAAEAEGVWVTRHIYTPRWVSYYLDLPVWSLTEDRLGLVRDSDLVMFRSDRIPEWLPRDASRDLVAESGDYRLITAAAVVP